MAQQVIQTDDILNTLRAHAQELQDRGVLHISLFGSAARGELTEDSDIDLALTLDPDCRIGLIALAGLQRHVSEILGRDVDLITLPVQRESLRSAIEHEAIRVF